MAEVLPVSNQEITSLVRAAQSGNKQAFDQLVRLYFGLVHTIAWGVVHNADDAQEIAQEVFLRVYLRLGDLRDPAMFLPWLRRVAQSLATNHRQRDQRRNFIAPTIAIDEEALQMADESLRTSLERRDHERRIEEAIARLPHEQRELLMLYYAEGWTLQAISERLDVDPTTVGRRLERAVKLLREKVGNVSIEGTRRLGSSPRAQARTLATIAAVAALPAASRAALVTAAEIPASAATAASGSAKVTSLAGLINSLLSTAPNAAVTGAVAMTKGKIAIIGTSIVVATAGGGAAYYYTHPPREAVAQVEIAEDTSNYIPAPGPSQFGHMMVGGWVGVIQDPKKAPDNNGVRTRRPTSGASCVVIIEENASGVLQAVTYLPERATGVRRSSQVTENADGSFNIVMPGIGGGISGTRNGNNITGWLNEGGTQQPLTLQRADMLPPIPRPAPRNSIVVEQSKLDSYTGSYAFTANNRMNVQAANGALLVNARGYDPLVMFPESETTFFSKEADVQMSFELDQSGKVIRISFVEAHINPTKTQYYRRIQ